MTREQALAELKGTWMFKEVDGSIALRESTLIRAVQDHENRVAFEQRELIPQKPAIPVWPSL